MPSPGSAALAADGAPRRHAPGASSAVIANPLHRPNGPGAPAPGSPGCPAAGWPPRPGCAGSSSRPGLSHQDEVSSSIPEVEQPRAAAAGGRGRSPARAAPPGGPGSGASCRRCRSRPGCPRPLRCRRRRCGNARGTGRARCDPDVLGQARDAGPQRADAADPQVDRDAGLRGAVQRVDHHLVDQRVGLEHDPGGLACLPPLACRSIRLTMPFRSSSGATRSRW